MSQELAYTFVQQLDHTESHGQTFALTLTREMLQNAKQITVKYILTESPIPPDRLQDNAGVMRSVVIPLPPKNPSIPQLVVRYNLAWHNATSYEENERNLEAPWKPVYRHVLLEVIYDMDSCDVLEEMPIWVFRASRDRLPLNATVTMPRGAGKTVYPDLCVVMYRGTPSMRNISPPRRFLPVLVELKRAISRSLTVQGYPVLTNPAAMPQLIGGFRVGQPQVELTAYLHLSKCQDQTHVVLIAGVGPWFRGLLVDRATVLGCAIQSFSEAEIAYRINESLEKDGEVMAAADQDDPQVANNNANLFQVNFQNNVYDAQFRAAALVAGGLDGLSYLNGWSDPMMLGTLAACQFWNSTQHYVRVMLSGGVPVFG